LPGSSSGSDAREIVRAGYDAIAERYAQWALSFESPDLWWVEDLLSRLDDGSEVLDLGCGGGRVPAKAVAARHRYRIRGWLRPGGWLLTTMGIGGSDDEVEDDWLGAPMFFASFDPETNRTLLAEAGFELVRDEVITHDEPGHGPVSFMWVLAKRA
jgi:SAM-dependent methyltransferase